MVQTRPPTAAVQPAAKPHAAWALIAPPSLHLINQARSNEPPRPSHAIGPQPQVSDTWTGEQANQVSSKDSTCEISHAMQRRDRPFMNLAIAEAYSPLSARQSPGSPREAAASSESFTRSVALDTRRIARRCVRRAVWCGSLRHKVQPPAFRSAASRCRGRSAARSPAGTPCR